MIARDATSSDTEIGSATVTFSHTCSGSNRLLIVVGGGLNTDAGKHVTGATYNGVAMTALGDSIRNDNNPKFAMRAFYLLNPASGAHDVVVTVEGGGATEAASAVAVSYTGVKQSNQPDASEIPVVIAEAGETHDSITTVADGSWAFMATVTHVTGGLSATRDAYEAIEEHSVVPPSPAQDYYVNLYDTNAAKTPAGAVDMGIDRTGGNQYVAYQVFSFAPSTAGGQILFI